MMMARIMTSSSVAIDPDVIDNSLVDIDGGGEEVDRQLLDQTDLDEPNEDAYISSEDKIESDLNDTYTP
ncbi:hypothetical protein CR513_39461, partial [Mucuna pruriens]